MAKLKYFYEVWVSSPKYHKDSYLTYSYNEKLKPGTPVVAPLNNTPVPALIVKEVSKPKFTTKNIKREISKSATTAYTLKLAEWLKEYYPAPRGQIMSLFLPTSLTSKPKAPGLQSRPEASEQIDLPPATKEQSSVLQKINVNTGKVPMILHGVTGSGKTHIYMELITESLKNDKSAILLTPEIGLTPQLAEECKSLFPGKTVVVHSRLTPAEKRDAWLSILEAKEPLVIVGARSALFSPVNNLGIVVVDEFHESSYKQEQAPHYLATRVAAKLAKLHDAQLLLGSATPSVADYYVFESKKLPIIKMVKQAAASKNPAKREPEKNTLKVVDLRERGSFSRSKWLCDDLIAEIGEALRRKEQSLVFLNRRGTARLVMCTNCGWQELCPNCDLPLTYHGDVHQVTCHTCGYTKPVRPSCPECGSSEIIFRSVGTKAIASELERLFPDTKIKRFDSDLAKKDRLESNFAKLKGGDYDIIVGTQMIGKGLDLPRLSVLGVVTADTSLSFPDYTSTERTYQLISQVLGRVDRGHLSSRTIIQTYHPENRVIKYALAKDYANFYKSELTERREFHFPPFYYTLKLTCSYARREDAEKAAANLAEKVIKNTSHIEVAGPSPKFIEKAAGRHRWQIVLKSKQRKRLLNIIRQLPANWSYDIDPVNLL